MTVEVATADDPTRWDRHVARSSQSQLAHRYDFLRTMATHSGAVLHPLVGYDGGEPIGVFPVFELSKGPITACFSPPPRLGVPYLGPALVDDRPADPADRDRLNAAFIRRCLAYVDDEIDPSYALVTPGCEYADVRPFAWQAFTPIPDFTYKLDLALGRDRIKRGFSRSLRRSIAADADADCSVGERGPEAIEFVVGQLRDRYEAQGKSFAIPDAFVSDLHRALPDGTIRTYVAEVAGEPAGGIILTETPRSITFWLGGAKPDVSVPVNERLHWRIITDAIDRGIREYDLNGAGVEDIARFKAKFNPELVPHHHVKRSTVAMNVVEGVYRKLHRVE